MNRAKAGRRAAVLLTGGLLTAVLAVGCNKTSQGPATGPSRPGPVAAAPDAAAPDVPAEFAAGRKVFDTSCARCHSLGGKGPMFAGGPPPGGPGPGGEPPPGGPPPGGPPPEGPPPEGPPPGGPGPGGPGPGRPRGRGPDLGKVGARHTRDWIADHIRDPQAHKPESRMPKFASKLSDDDLRAVADYLASLKGT